MPGLICGAIVVDDRGRIAMVKEGKQWARGKWSFPGGKLEQGEGIPEAARREVREEAGINVKIQGLIGIYRETKYNVTYFMFLAKPTEVKLRHRKGEVLDARWFTEKEILDLKDTELRSQVMRQQFSDWKSGKLYPLSVIRKF